MEKWLLRMGWGTMAAFASILFFLTGWYYFSFRLDVHFLKEKQDVVHNLFWITAFYIHISGGMLAIITGPVQFLKAVRSRYWAFHRAVGKVYLFAILIMAGPSGLFMAFYAEGGPISIVGFTVMALLWLFTTWKALEAIRARKINEHRNWMVRSYAMCFAAVTLRLWMPTATYYLGISPEFAVTVSAWVSWIPNLIVAELLIRFIPKKI